MTPEEIGRLGKEEVIITGKGMFPIRTNRVSYYQDHRFKALNDGQKGKPWPEIPVRQRWSVVTRYDEFLKGAGSSRSTEPEEPEPEPNPRQALSQRAAVSRPRSLSVLDKGTADYGFFEDPSELAANNETQEDRKLTDAIESVKAPDLAAHLGDLLNLAPINPETEHQLAELAHRLSPDELINRLLPLLNGEIFYSLREAQILIEQWRRHYNTKRPPQCTGLPPASARNHHLNGSQANDALTINLDQSDEAAHDPWRRSRRRCLESPICRMLKLGRVSV